MTAKLFRRVSRPLIATQWMKPGDHPAVRDPGMTDRLYYHIGDQDVAGVVRTVHGERRVCPGDWIIEEHGRIEVVPDFQFKRQFEPAPPSSLDPLI